MEMRKFSALACSLLALAVTGPFSASAADLPAIPEKAGAETFKQAPAPWRDHLLQVRAAERIADPLQRCLAFPDLPGNQWPAGHAAAHCRHHHAIKRPTLAEIGGRVERGELAQLEAMMDASLQRHFSESDFGEDIHDTFEYLLRSSDAETDQVTAAWLHKAPDSAYANLARAAFYHGSAWKARGGKYVAQTADENLRRMSGFVDQAIPYYEKAIALNPRLIPAYTALVNLGMLDSRRTLRDKAMDMAAKLDPACIELARDRMRVLEPRWGGSYEQMLAHANHLSTYLERRPQLAIHVGAPYADRGDRLIAEDQYTRQTAEILEIAIKAGSDEDALRDAADVAMNLKDGDPDRWKGLAYLLQEERFRETNAWGKRAIAWELVQPEPEWSLRYSQRAVELDADKGFGHYLLAAGYYNAKQYEKADRHYRIALEDETQRRASLRELSTMWLFDSGLEGKAAADKARPFIDRFNKEYPDDGAGWIMQLNLHIATQDPIDDQLLQTILKTADRKNPWQASAVKKIEEMRRRMGAK
jgi:tetratricopeptide (TPR) repeat protein